MTPQQMEAIARADAMMKPGLELYEHRCNMFRLVCRLELRDLKRLTALLGFLSDGDLAMVARYAEGLAEFNGMPDHYWEPDAEKVHEASWGGALGAPGCATSR